MTTSIPRRADFPWSLTDCLIPPSPGVKESGVLSRLPDSEFALVASNDHGEERRLLPCYSKESAAASAAILVAWSDRLPELLVKEAAARLRAVPGVAFPQLPASEPRVEPARWEFQRLFVPEEPVKTSAPAPAPTTRIGGFLADENPLRGAPGEWVTFSTVHEAKNAAEKLSSMEGSRSSLTLFRAARAIVDSLRSVGIKASSARLPPEVRDYYAHTLSEDCALVLEMRRDDARHIKKTSSVDQEKISQVYLDLVNTGLREHQSWKGDDAWRFAEKLSHLEDYLGVDALPIHRALFKTSMDDLMDEDDPIVYSAHNRQLRRSELEAMSMMDLTPIEKFFTAGMVERLKTSPEETFMGASEAHKLFLLRFLSDERTDRGNRL